MVSFCSGNRELLRIVAVIGPGQKSSFCHIVKGHGKDQDFSVTFQAVSPLINVSCSQGQFTTCCGMVDQPARIGMVVT